MRQSLTIQPVYCWIGSKVSDACSETPHKACSHSLFVPEISEMINSCGIPVEMAVKLQRPHSIPHAKTHWQPWPFCASAANGTLSSSVSGLKDQYNFVGIKKLVRQSSCLPDLRARPCLGFGNVKDSRKRERSTGGEEQRMNRGETQRDRVESSSELKPQMAKNERRSVCENHREKGLHSLLNPAHSRGGKAVYSFSNAHVSVWVCLCLTLTEQK